MVGWGGGGIGPGPRKPGRLLVFKLGANTQLPAYPAYVAAPPLDLAQAVASTGNTAEGDRIYRAYCNICHRAGGVYFPELSRSPMILDPAVFRNVVFDGALQKKGMASFSHLLNADDIENLRAYFLQAATGPAVAAPTVPQHAQ